jgi:hypothetical protein
MSWVARQEGEEILTARNIVYSEKFTKIYNKIMIFTSFNTHRLLWTLLESNANWLVSRATKGLRALSEPKGNSKGLGLT